MPILKLGYLPAWILALSLLNGLTFNYVRICKHFNPVQSRNTHFKMFLSPMPYIVSNFSHHSKVKVEETAHQTFRGTDMNGQEDRVKQAAYKPECLNTCCSPTLATSGRSVRASSYSQASRVGVGLRARRNGTAPASGAEAQRDLEAPNLEMTHTSGGASVIPPSPPPIHPPIPSCPHSHPASLKGPVMYEFK